MDHQHGRVERFLKLGYTHRDILRVLESLHHEAQTNDILEELIKTCQTNSSTDTTSSTTSRPAHNSPQLIPRGCSPPQASTSPSPPPLQLRNSIERDSTGGFRPVVIDGSNVAISHGNKKVFSCRGLQLAVRWFWERGIRDITVFVPLWRKEQPRPEAPITDQHILHELEKRKILVFTPSRCVNGKRVVCYDDRYIIKLAYDSDGIIVSNDNYRDLQIEKPQWKKFIEERLLMYSFANDKFMPPDDPLGRNGPTIDNFLSKKPWTLENKQQHCPYGKKCTYGVKCKFYHPERSNQSQLSVADELRAKSKPAADREQPYVLPAGSQGSGQETLMYTAPYHEPDRTTQQYRYPSTPPFLRTEDYSHRSSSCELFTQQRDSGSPGLLRPPSLRLCPSPGLCPSPDTDEAFGSMESSLSRLYIQDSSRSYPNSVSYAYSSGVAGCSQGSEDCYYSFGTQGHLSSGGYHTPPSRAPQCGCDRPRSCELRACNHVVYGQQAHLRAPSLPSAERGSYPGPFPRDESAHLGYYTARNSHSLPDYAWGGQCPSDVGAGLREDCFSGEDRRNLSIQLSTLFPQRMVEQVMSRYPHILEMDKLVPLIHSFRTSHCSF